MDSEYPLPQRLTGRRSKRRQERLLRERGKKDRNNEDDDDDDDEDDINESRGASSGGDTPASNDGDDENNGDDQYNRGEPGVGGVDVSSGGEEDVDGASEAVDDVADAAEGRRRVAPDADIEARIDAAVAARKQSLESNVRRTAAYDRSYSDDQEDDDDRGDENDDGEGASRRRDTAENYEYADHTADVQLHSWGRSLEGALEQLARAMFGYMTELNLVRVDLDESHSYGSDVRASGHDAQSLVFAFLQEWLEVFHETGFVAKRVTVIDLDRDNWTARSSAVGERFDNGRHLQGTEVKAVTYSNLQVVETFQDDGDGDGGEPRCDIWAIVDI